MTSKSWRKTLSRWGIFLIEIIIPKGVYKELRQEGKEFPLEEWIKVKELKDRDLFKALRLSLDYGEGAAIAFYLENGMDFLLPDDKEARSGGMK